MAKLVYRPGFDARPTTRDSQRGKCYAWERIFRARKRVAACDRVTGAEARAIADRLFTAIGIDAPHIVMTGRTGRSYYYPHRHECRIAKPWKRTSLAHELAHAILKRRPLASHGAEYCALLAALYAWQFKLSETSLRDSMREHGLKVTQ
jgi:hypothetical protein